MPTPSQAERLSPYLLLAAFVIVSAIFRPLLPIDETRYLAVAWEMFSKRDFLVPTLNFEPYFQKPPLLFWLIEIAWALLGVSRTAALAVIFLISSLSIYLTQLLAETLFPDNPSIARRVPWLMLGNVVFIIYSSLILFDLLLTVCVLAAVLALLDFAKGLGASCAVAAGLFVGLGALAKGPVVLVHVAAPILLYQVWRDPVSSLRPRRFFSGMVVVAAAALLPVASWLEPVFHRLGSGFAYDLVWRQAAGRVSGSLPSAHSRPFYFYLELLPITLLPWILSPQLWRSKPWLLWQADGITSRDKRFVQLLALWPLVVLVTFSLIAGKQPHYLVPALPPVIILFGYFMATIPLGAFKTTSAAMLAAAAVVQAVGSVTVFPRFDMAPAASFVAAKAESELAFYGRYQGELTFLARLDRPFATVSQETWDQWLRTHPRGYVVAKVRGSPNTVNRLAFSQCLQKEKLVILEAVGKEGQTELGEPASTDGEAAARCRYSSGGMRFPARPLQACACQTRIERLLRFR
jgi:4-amino-4-deoxy-L-arabinose transferase-like glycosyltransferase